MLEVIFRTLGHSKLPGTQGLLWRLGAFASNNDRPFEISWRDLSYRGNLSFWIDRFIYFQGAFAPAELDFLARTAAILRKRRSFLTMLDIGANVGQHSLAMASRYDRILAFEPSAAVSERLIMNIKHNNIRNVEVYGIALGDQDETAILGTGLNGNDGSRSLNWSFGGGDQVTVRHAGDFLTSITPPLPQVDVIKLDVEGNELAVLSALRSFLIQDRPILLFELVGKQSKGGFENIERLESTLYPDHYLFALEGRKRARLVPFEWRRHEEGVCLPIELVDEFKALM